MNSEQHRSIVDMAACADTKVSTDIIKYMLKMQGEIDDLKNVISDLLEKEYPEDVLKYAEFLKVD